MQKLKNMEDEFLDYMREEYNKALPFDEMVRAELGRLNMKLTELEQRIAVLQTENVNLEGYIKEIVKWIKKEGE
jgi:uncharacterized small protein (DUF1192 family)